MPVVDSITFSLSLFLCSLLLQAVLFSLPHSLTCPTCWVRLRCTLSSHTDSRYILRWYAAIAAAAAAAATHSHSFPSIVERERERSVVSAVESVREKEREREGRVVQVSVRSLCVREESKEREKRGERRESWRHGPKKVADLSLLLCFFP